MNSLKFNKGISLIALILIIVVMIILAGTIISAYDNTNLMPNSKRAIKKSDFQTMLDNYNEVYQDLLYKNFGDESLITDDDLKDKGIVPEKYTNLFKVSKDGLEYVGNDEVEKEIAGELGIKTNDSK